MFSKSFKYGIRAVTYLASQSLEGRRVSIEEIAEHTDTPLAFTAKILRTLTQNEVIDSKTGPSGGFFFEKEKMKKTTFSDIVDIIDGDDIYKSCVLGLKQCSDTNPCPMHKRFKEVREHLTSTIKSTSIYDLAIDLRDGKGTLKQIL